jgi:hypothetical protein
VPPPLPQPEREPTEPVDDFSEKDEQAPPLPKNGGRWDHFLLIFLGMLLLAFGEVQVKKAFFTAKPVPVKESDLFFFKAQIMGGVKVPRRVNNISFLDGIQGIDIVAFHLQEEGAKKAVHSILELPADLPFDSAWEEPGNLADIGVLKKDYNPEALRNRRWDFSMAVTTLKVNSKSLRTLAQHNVALANSQSQFLTFAGPGMMLLGAFSLLLGCEKWNARSKARR